MPISISECLFFFIIVLSYFIFSFVLLLMTPQVPDLPPRQLPEETTIKKESSSFFSPLALLNHLETNQSDHKHIFKSISPEDRRFACSLCHVWLQVAPSTENYDCSQYPCHHYHATKTAYECCGCQYQLRVEYRAPLIPFQLIKQLETTRPKGRSFAQSTQQKESSPTMASTLSTILIYVQDLLSGTRRNINTNNPNFLAKIGNTKER